MTSAMQITVCGRSEVGMTIIIYICLCVLCVFVYKYIYGSPPYVI